MANLPKIKVKWWSLGEPEEEKTYDFEKAKEVIFGDNSWTLAFVNGEIIKTYEELVELASRDEYKNKEELNVSLLIPAVGGG